MVVFVCEDSPEGIFTGVYDAWSSRLGHENVRLEVQGEYNYSLFSEYREVAVDQLKDYLENGNIRNSVNFPNVYLDRSGVMRMRTAPPSSLGAMPCLNAFSTMGCKINEGTIVSVRSMESEMRHRIFTRSPKRT